MPQTDISNFIFLMFCHTKGKGKDENSEKIEYFQEPIV
jgi:hypothetical protein